MVHAKAMHLADFILSLYHMRDVRMPKKYNNISMIRKEFAKVMKRDLNKQLFDELSSSLQTEDIQQSCKNPVPPGYRLLRIDGRIKSENETFELALLCDTTHEVAYYKRVIVTSICDLNAKPATQSLVWRTPDIAHKAATRDLASNIFFEYILPRYDAILSDGNQTSGGQFFWETQITSSLQRGHHIYFYKMMSAELEPIKSREDLDLLKDMIWGDSDHHQHNLVLISEEELPLERKYTMPVEIIEELDKEDANTPIVVDNGLSK